MVTSNKIKGKLLTLKRLKNMATENGWSLTTTPSVFETKLLKASEVKQVTPYYTGATDSSGLYIKSFYSVAPVTIIVSQSIDGQTLTANITGNTTGGTYADNKITWDNLTAMNFSGYAYYSTRTDNFE